MCSEERRRRNIKTCCVSLEMAVADMMYFFFSFERELCFCVSLKRELCFFFFFLFFIFYFFFILRFRFKGNREKWSDHDSQNRAVEPQFQRLLAFLA